MSFYGNTEWYEEVAEGNIPGHSLVIIRGHTPAQSSASGFVDVSEFGDLAYLTSAETMEIVSTSTNDASAGIGLRTLMVSGVDNTGALITEVITLNGTTNVQTTKSYLRVNFLIGLTAGSTGWNIGTVTATATTASTVQNEMDTEESISQGSHYTVPLNKRLLLKQLELNAAKVSGGGSPRLEFRGYARVGGEGAAWLQLFDNQMDTGVINALQITLPFPSEIATRSDIRLRTDTDTNNTAIHTRLYGVLVDN